MARRSATRARRKFYRTGAIVLQRKQKIQQTEVLRFKDKERKWREIKKERQRKSFLSNYIRTSTCKFSGVPQFALLARFFVVIFFPQRRQHRNNKQIPLPSLTILTANINLRRGPKHQLIVTTTIAGLRF